MRLSTALLALALMTSCSGPPTGPPARVDRAHETLATGAQLASQIDELEQDLLLQLQDRAGRFINQITQATTTALADPSLNLNQRRWLRTLRLDAVQGILWAIQRENVIEAEIETLFFTRLLHTLKVQQAREMFSTTQTSTLETALAHTEDIFWAPLEPSLGNWASRIDNAVKEFIQRRPHAGSIAFASSDLYVIADDTTKRQLHDLFGLDARIEAAAQGIERLNNTADRALFLAEFMPALTTLYVDTAAADLLDSIDAKMLGDIQTFPERLNKTATDLASAFAKQRAALSDTLEQTGSALNHAINQLDQDLSRHVRDVSEALQKQISTLEGRLEGIESAADQLERRMSQLDTSVATLAKNVSRLTTIIDDMPDDVINTIAAPDAKATEAIHDMLWRSVLTIAFIAAGAMVLMMSVLLVAMRWLYRPRH